MKTCVLHVGMSKTGTTSIQSTLSQADDVPGFHYLQSGEANAGRALSAAFMREPDKFRPNRKLGLDKAKLAQRRADVLADLERQLNEPATVFVASSEMLGNFDEADLTALRKWLAARVDAIRVMAYVREPASYIESMLQQSLKNGNNEFDVAKRDPNYRERFAPLERVFGREQLTYRAFTPKTFPNQCVVRDFMSVIGVDLPASEIKRINESLSREAVGLLFAFRRHGPEFGEGPEAMRRNRALIRWLGDLPGSRLRLAPTLLAPVINANAADLSWMSERLGAPLLPQYTEDDGEALHGEADLLHFSPATLAWLRKATGTTLRPAANGAVDPADIARALEPLWSPRMRSGSAVSVAPRASTPLQRDAAPQASTPEKTPVAPPPPATARRRASADMVPALPADDEPVFMGSSTVARAAAAAATTGRKPKRDRPATARPEGAQGAKSGRRVARLAETGAQWDGAGLGQRLRQSRPAVVMADDQIAIIAEVALQFVRDATLQRSGGARIAGWGSFQRRGELAETAGEASGRSRLIFQVLQDNSSVIDGDDDDDDDDDDVIDEQDDARP